MKKILLLTIAGLLFISLLPYAAVGSPDFANLTVSDTVSIGTNDPDAINFSNILVAPSGWLLTPGTWTSGPAGSNWIRENGSTVDCCSYFADGKSISFGSKYYKPTGCTGTQILTVAEQISVADAGKTSTLYKATGPSNIAYFISLADDGHYFSLFSINNKGQVGINTENPEATLDVNGTIAVSGNPIIDTTGNWIGSPPSACTNADTVDGKHASAFAPVSGVGGNFNVAGKVGIGTTAPNAKLQVKGSVSLGSGTAQTNKLLCWTSNGAIGYCSSVITTGVSCNCTAIP